MPCQILHRWRFMIGQLAINYLKVLTDVITPSNFPHVLDTSTKFSAFVRNACCAISNSLWIFSDNHYYVLLLRTVTPGKIVKKHYFMGFN